MIEDRLRLKSNKHVLIITFLLILLELSSSLRAQPSITDFTRFTSNNVAYIFSAQDFEEVNNGTGPIENIQILNIPTPSRGIITDNGVVITTAALPYTVSVADINAAKLKFVPAPGFEGSCNIRWDAEDNTNGYSGSPDYIIMRIGDYLAGCTVDSPPRIKNISVALDKQFTGTGKNPYITPFVGDFNGDGDTDLFSGGASNFRIMDPTMSSTNDATLVDFGLTKTNGSNASSVAIADVFTWDDNTNMITSSAPDGKAEIFYYSADGGDFLTCLTVTFDGSNTAIEQVWQIAMPDAAAVRLALSVHDINADGKEELIAWGQVFDVEDGDYMLDMGAVAGFRGFPYGALDPDIWSTVTVYDALTDAQTTYTGNEVFLGHTVLSVELTNYDGTAGNTAVIERNSDQLNADGAGTLTDGVVSLADMDLDGDVDAVVSAWGYVYVWDIQTDGAAGLMSDIYELPSSGTNPQRSSNASIGDFDNDGYAEFVVVSQERLSVFEDIVNSPTITPLWGENTTDDSGSTTVSTFDFFGTGEVAFAYRDETSLRIFNGATADVLFTGGSCTSATGTEVPVIADVDGDGETEIIVGCGDGSGTINIYKSANIPWVQSRSLWNQNNYNVVNINDDLSIPTIVGGNHTDEELNNHFAQKKTSLLGGTGIDAADLSIALTDLSTNVDLSNCPTSIDATFQVTNNDTDPINQTIDISFFDGDPRISGASTLLNATTISVNLSASSTDDYTVNIDVSTGNEIVFTLLNHPGTYGDITDAAVTDRISFPFTNLGECDYTNNVYGPLTLDGCTLSEPPFISLDPDNSYGGADDDGFDVSYGAGGSVVHIADIDDATLTDDDDVDLTLLELVVSGVLDGADEQLVFTGTDMTPGQVYPLDADGVATKLFGSTTFNISYTSATGKFEVTNDGGGNMPIVDLELLLRGIGYSNSAVTVSSGQRQVSFVAFDNIGASNTVVSTINVTNATLEICDNGIDDDGDGLVDCFDPDCTGSSSCGGFYFNQPIPSCIGDFTRIGDFELEEDFRTDKDNYPIDQRSGVFVGDLDRDGISELVGKNPGDNGVGSAIQIFSGVDGSLKRTISLPAKNHSYSQVAIGNIDNDNSGDIFIMLNDNKLYRYDVTGAKVWESSALTGSNMNHATPHLADFDEDGVPEVYVGASILDATDGSILVDSNNSNVSSGNVGSDGDRLPIAFDVFENGDPLPPSHPSAPGSFGSEADGLELIAGDKVYTVDLVGGMIAVASQITASDITSKGGGDHMDGFTSIADMDGDDEVDVIVVSAGQVYAWNPRTESQLGYKNLTGTNNGGRANVGDFDNDGQVEIGVAGRNYYFMLEYNAGGEFQEGWTKGDGSDSGGIDDGSERTGSTLFDFEGDGRNEVVYSEEENLLIFDGVTGDVLASVTSQSGTRTDYPLVADVNADGQSEIIVTAQDRNGPSNSEKGYITVYKSAKNPWVGSRETWNQHGYYVTNVNNDLTVPQQVQDPLRIEFDRTIGGQVSGAFNGFLVQTTFLTATGVPTLAAADAVATITNLEVDANGIYTVTYDLANSASASLKLPADMNISFWNGDPDAGGVLIDTDRTTQSIEPGDGIVGLTFEFSGIGTVNNVYVVANNSGARTGASTTLSAPGDYIIAECDYDNNSLFLAAPVNVAPQVDLNGSDELGFDHETTFTEDGGEVELSQSSEALVLDGDGSDIKSATITLTNFPDGTDEALAVTVGATGIVAAYDDMTGILTLTGTTSLADYQQVIRTLTYNNVSNDPDATDRIVEVQITDDTDKDSNTAIATVNVTPVNDPPTAADNTLTTPEDTPLLIQTVDFGYNDVDGDVLDKVTVSTLPGKGTLFYDINNNQSYDAGEELSASDEISKVDLDKDSLYYVPVANETGDPYTTFTFTVNDGTVDSNPANTITIDVTPVNDPPTAADNTLTTPEDTPLLIQTGDFGYNDIDGDVLDKVTVSTLPGKGTLFYDINNNQSYDAGEELSASDQISKVDLDKDSLYYVPVANETGDPYTTFTFTVNDGTVDSNPANTITIDVTPVNDPPTAADNTLTTPEDTPLLIQTVDFGYNDIDGDVLDKVTVSTLPGKGTLFYDINNNQSYDAGEELSASDEISKVDLDKDSLYYVPLANETGDPYTAFTFTVNDGTVDSNPANTITIDVTPVNDPPVADDEEVTTMEDTDHTFTAGDFNDSYSDTESDVFAGIRITSLPDEGLLKYNGTTLIAGDVSGSGYVVASADIGNLVFTPDADENGAVYTEFNFEVYDGTDYSTSAYEMVVNVTPVNDPPVADDEEVTTLEDTDHTFTAGDFNDSYSDTESDVFAGIRITSLPDEGVLKYNGTTLVAGDVSGSGYVVASADIGNLVFTPDTDENGAVYTEFNFEVYDGTDYSTSAYEMVVNVTPVNDPPVADDEEVTTLEDTDHTFTAGDFNDSYSDTESDVFAGIRITSLPDEGVLKYNGTTLVAGDVSGSGYVVASADIGNLVFTPDADENGAVYTEFNFEVYDGTDYSTSAYEMIVNVTPVNDPPALTLDDNNSGGGADDGGFEATFTEGDAALNVGDVDTGLSDVDDTEMSTFKITAANLEDGDEEELTIGGTTIPLGTNAAFTGITIGGTDFDFAYDATTGEVVVTKNGGGNLPVVDLVILMQSITYEHASDHPTVGSPRTFTFDTNDGTDDATSVVSTITIMPVNDPPTAADKTLTTPEDTRITVVTADFGYSDLEDDPLAEITIGTIAGRGTFFVDADDDNVVDPGEVIAASDLIAVGDLDAGRLKFIPVANENGNGYASFTFTVSDGIDDAISENTITINVTPVNDQPICDDETLTTPEDTPLTIKTADFDYSDPEGSPLVDIIITSLPDNGTLYIDENENGIPDDGEVLRRNEKVSLADLNQDRLTFLPDPNEVGSPYTDFDFRVSDGTDVSTSQYTITINVTPVNDPPVAEDDDYVVDEDTPLEGNVLDNDEDPEGPLTVSETPLSGPDHGELTLNPDGTFTYLPEEDFVGEDTFVYEACDSGDPVICVEATVTITIEENRSVDIAVEEVCIRDTPYVQYEITAVGFTPEEGATITWRKIDGEIAEQLLDQPLTGTLLWPGAEVDAEGNPTAWPGWLFENGMWIQLNDGLRPEMTLEVSLNPENSVVVSYPPATPECNANPRNRPVANDDGTSIGGGETAEIPLPDNDEEGDSPLDPSTIILIDPGDPTNVGDKDTPLTIPGEGTYTVDEEGTLTFVPENGFGGTATIEYTIDDEVGERSDPATVVIEVSDPTGGPVADDFTIEVKTIEGTSSTVIPHIFDPNGGPLTISKISDPDVGTLVFNPDGTFTYVHPPGFEGPVEFVYEVCDSGTPIACDQGTVTIIVLPMDTDEDSLLDSFEVDDPDDPKDSDEDGTPDYLDPDDDGDMVPTIDENYDGDDDVTNQDTDGDGTPDYLDVDDDGDSLLTADEDVDLDNDPQNDDVDNDTAANYLDIDSDGDGISDEFEGLIDTDGDGTPDFADLDSDDDGVPDIDEVTSDNPLDDDCDGDGIPDFRDPFSCDEFPVNQVMTPNFDGINDIMEITGIEYFPNNEVFIFNRWGNLVWRIEGYDNVSQVFTGFGNEGNLGSTDLPDGTYFYIIDRRDGTDVQKGFVVIKR